MIDTHGGFPEQLAEMSARLDAVEKRLNNAPEWHPYETTPKDRRVIVLCSDTAPFPVMIARWNGETFVSADECVTGKKWNILGWLPLPEPPK